MTDDQAVPLPDDAVARDPRCMHCGIPLTPCTCWRGRGCEHNGWTHVQPGQHQCPGMQTKAYPSSASLRAMLSPNTPRPDDPLVLEVADMLRRIENNYAREGSGPGSRFEGRLLEDVQAERIVQAWRERHDR